MKKFITNSGTDDCSQSMVAKPRSGIMNTIKLLSFLLLLSFSTCESCKEEKEWTTLPPETQTGANTFGCYINNNLFVPKRLYGNPSASYYRELNILAFGCQSGSPNMLLQIDSPMEGEYHRLSYGRISPSFNEIMECGCNTFACNNCGQVYLTKLDTIKRIVSGTFEFSGRCADFFFDVRPMGDSVVHITKGRFDIKLNIY